MKNKDDFFIELYDEFVDDNLSSIYDWWFYWMMKQYY
jgi:hypothetical protein